MNLDEVIEQFRCFLIESYKFLPRWLLTNDEQMAEYFQANWEILVESRLNELNLMSGAIDVYGDGADCNGASSRVSIPELRPTAAVHIKNGCVLHSFGSTKNGYFEMIPPFDFVKGEFPGGGELVLSISEADFSIGGSYDNLAT